MVLYDELDDDESHQIARTGNKTNLSSSDISLYLTRVLSVGALSRANFKHEIGLSRLCLRTFSNSFNQKILRIMEVRFDSISASIWRKFAPSRLRPLHPKCHRVRSFFVQFLNS